MEDQEDYVNRCCFCYKPSYVMKSKIKTIDSPENIYNICHKYICSKYFSPEFLQWSQAMPLPFCKKCLMCAQNLSVMNNKIEILQKEVVSFVESFTLEFLDRREKLANFSTSESEPDFEENDAAENFFKIEKPKNTYLADQIKEEVIEPGELFEDDDDDKIDVCSPEESGPFSPLDEKFDINDSFFKTTSKADKIIKKRISISLRRIKVTVDSEGNLVPDEGALPRRRAAVKAEELFCNWSDENMERSLHSPEVDQDSYNSDNSDDDWNEEAADEVFKYGKQNKESYEKGGNNTHSGEKDSQSKRFKCHICNVSYVQKKNLTLHSLKHFAEASSKKQGRKSNNQVSIVSNTNKKKIGLRSFKCKECGKLCNSKGMLFYHRQGHKDAKKEIKCEICHKIFKNALTLQKHGRIHAERIALMPCLTCGKLFKSRSGLKDHEIQHHADENERREKYECKECGTICKSKGTFFYHRENHKSTESEIKCEICHKVFKNVLTLHKHGRIHSEKNVLPCPTCGKMFKSRSGLKEHRILHNENEKKEKKFNCSTCNMSFISTSRLKRHSLMHSDERPFGPCEACGKRFRTSSALKDHSRIHDGKDRLGFKCQICNKMYTTKSNLTQHMFRHNEEKIFECSVCGKKFGTRDSLTTHSKYHKGEKSFLCDECGKSFWTKTKLKIHYRIHTGDLLPCEYCDKKFDTSTHLKQHYRSHNRKLKESQSTHNQSESQARSKVTFQCSNCPMIFDNEITLTEHKTIHDPDNSTFSY